MQVDSYMFLPRSMRPLYEEPEQVEGEQDPVWAEFEPRLSDARITLLTSGGLYLGDEQEPFDGERERREPTWGDPTYRLIPHGVEQDRCAMMHLHVDNDAVLADRNIALPDAVLDELAADGVVGGATDQHVSVMGYQGYGEDALGAWREETAPAIVEHLRDMRTDGIVLAPV